MVARRKDVDVRSWEVDAGLVEQEARIQRGCHVLRG